MSTFLPRGGGCKVIWIAGKMKKKPLKWKKCTGGKTIPNVLLTANKCRNMARVKCPSVLWCYVCVWMGIRLGRLCSLIFLLRSVWNIFPSCSLSHKYEWNPHMFCICLPICMSTCTELYSYSAVLKGAKSFTSNYSCLMFSDSSF